MVTFVMLCGAATFVTGLGLMIWAAGKHGGGANAMFQNAKADKANRQAWEDYHRQQALREYQGR